MTTLDREVTELGELRDHQPQGRRRRGFLTAVLRALRSGAPIVTLLRVPGSFERRVVAVESGCELVYDESAWRDAIVEVEAGEIELEWESGYRETFNCGDLFWLAPLPLRALRNSGRERAVLVAFSRRGRHMRRRRR